MQKKPTLLVSACLLGQPVRYDGQGKAMAEDLLTQLAERYQLLSICPECAGGLPTPRAAAEIYGGDGSAVLRGEAQVLTATGAEVSAEFIAGAHLARQMAERHGCKLALLKANSPSCGNQHIYSGNFDGHLQRGAGVTAALLQQHGCTVMNEDEAIQLIIQQH